MVLRPQTPEKSGIAKEASVAESTATRVADRATAKVSVLRRVIRSLHPRVLSYVTISRLNQSRNAGVLFAVEQSQESLWCYRQLGDSQRNANRVVDRRGQDRANSRDARLSRAFQPQCIEWAGSIFRQQNFDIC